MLVTEDDTINSLMVNLPSIVTSFFVYQTEPVLANKLSPDVPELPSLPEVPIAPSDPLVPEVPAVPVKPGTPKGIIKNSSLSFGSVKPFDDNWVTVYFSYPLSNGNTTSIFNNLNVDVSPTLTNFKIVPMVNPSK